MEFGASLLNLTLAGSFSVVGKARHMISFATPGMRNFGGRGNEVTDAVKGESIR